MRGLIESWRNGWLGFEGPIVRRDDGEDDFAFFAGSGESHVAAVGGRKRGTVSGASGKLHGRAAGKRQFEDKAGAVALFQVVNQVTGAGAHRKTFRRAVRQC